MNTIAFFLLAAVPSVIVAQHCNSAYNTYLECIKHKLDASYGKFETEFGEDYKKLAFSCFSTDANDARNGKACVVKDIGALDNAFDAHGPLGDCQFCLKVAQQVQKLFLEAPEKTMKCIRHTVIDIIGKEMSKCVKAKEPSFVLPNIPDFDEKSEPYRQQIIDNLGVFIQTDSILGRCQRNSERRGKRSAYSNSQSCINKKVLNGKPIWAQHCSTIKQCHHQVSSSCQSDFKRVESIACNCIEEGRQELSDLVDVNGRKLLEVAKAESPQGGGCSGDLSAWKICRCKAIANDIIESNKDRVDVKKVLDEILGCTDLPAAQKELISVDKFIDIGCKRLGQPGDAGLRSAAELATGVDFIGKMLDGMVARVTRFCPNESCRV